MKPKKRNVYDDWDDRVPIDRAIVDKVEFVEKHYWGEYQIKSNCNTFEIVLTNPKTNKTASLHIIKGTIPREKVEAVCNPSKRFLNHMKGVAGDIIKNGGHSI